MDSESDSSHFRTPSRVSDPEDDLPEDCHPTWRAFSLDVVQLVQEQTLGVDFDQPALPQILELLDRSTQLIRTLSRAVGEYHEAE